MGLFDGLFGKKNPPVETEFVLGIEDIFKLKDSTDLIVVGRLKGKVVPGAAVYIHGFADVDEPITLTAVKEIEIEGKGVSEASDSKVALRLENVSGADLRIGSVLATRSITVGDVHTAYINAIGDAYIARRHLDLSDEEFEKMSLTDMSEAWRLYIFDQRRQGSLCNDDQEVMSRKLDRLGDKMTQKVLGLEEANIVYSTLTGEPFFFSRTIDNKDGTYKCMPPEVMLITKPYLSAYQKNYSQNGFEIKTITGKDKINSLLGHSFYLNGGCGLRINGEDAGIASEKLIAPPKFEGVPKISIPIMNPDLMRWILLMGQMGEPSTEDAKLIYGLYYSFFLRELPKAKFLIPMQHDIPCPPADENGNTVFKENTQIRFPTLPGKEDREAVRMYTDWARLREAFGDEWSGMIQPVSGMIDVFDCAINVTDHPAIGCYVSKATYEEAEKKSNTENNC